MALSIQRSASIPWAWSFGIGAVTITFNLIFASFLSEISLPIDGGAEPGACLPTQQIYLQATSVMGRLGMQDGRNLPLLHSPNRCPSQTKYVRCTNGLQVEMVSLHAGSDHQVSSRRMAFEIGNHEHV